MRYKANKEVVIATYADGGITASVIRSEINKDNIYHYMCVFEDEECARKFAEDNLREPVFFSTKKMGDLAKEFNTSFAYPGMAGVVYIDKNGGAEHVDTDAFIKKAYNGLKKNHESYGGPLVANNQMVDVHDVDFNKKYYIMFNREGHFMSKRETAKDGKKREWLVLATNQNVLSAQADEFKIKEENRQVVEDTLYGILYSMQPGNKLNHFSGIMYVDESGSKMISKRKILKLLDDRLTLIDELFAQTEIYMDAKYFVSAEIKSGSPTISMEGGEFIMVSQRMDVMLTAFKLEGMDTNKMVFTGLLSLREILAGCEADDYDGLAICIDDNPDHVINLTIDEIYDVALDGDGEDDEDNNKAYVYSDDEYMTAEKRIMVAGDGYIIAEMRSNETGEMSRVIFIGDDEDVMRSWLESTGYHEENDRTIERPMYEIFAEFRDDGQLSDCDGAMCFEEDGYYIIPKEEILDSLAEWEETSHKVPVKVELDMEDYHCVAMADYRPMTFIDQDGVTFVVVAKNEEYLEWAVMELFGDDEDIVYDNSKTLRQIMEAAVFGDMGIAMCQENGITFIEPKRLSQTLDEDDDY